MNRKMYCSFEECCCDKIFRKTAANTAVTQAYQMPVQLEGGKSNTVKTVEYINGNTTARRRCVTCNSNNHLVTGYNIYFKRRYREIEFRKSFCKGYSISSCKMAAFYL